MIDDPIGFIQQGQQAELLQILKDKYVALFGETVT
jgi:hypothetical protein